MVAALYPRLKGRANVLLRRYGAPAKVRLPPVADVGSDPWAPTYGAPQDYATRVVMTDYSQADRDGTLVQQNDRRAYFPANGMPANLTEAAVIVLDAEPSAPWNIVRLAPLNPGGLVLMYEAQVRR